MAEFEQTPISVILRRAVWIGLVLWACAATIYVPFVLPTIATNSYTITPGLVTSIAALAFPAFAAALIVAILRLNTLPMRVLFQPSRARVLGSLGLWLVLPLWAFLLSPVSAAMHLVLWLGVWVGGEGGMPLLLITSVATLVACYGIACSLSSGLPNWKIRCAAYCLIWWAAYLGIFLYGGLMTEI